ncbi:DUF742 domain-containing protein [Virgisporangium aliadipatigenens]|nr:DUF742 domain-containing protein [Virgisporangium aliadipatigenens]
MTRGRTRPVRGTFDLISMVVATRNPPAADAGPGLEHLPPEQQAIVRRCREPLSVAEISAHLNLPLGTVRVMLGDLLDAGLIRIHDPGPADQPHSRLYEALIDGLRQL